MHKYTDITLTTGLSRDPRMFFFKLYIFHTHFSLFNLNKVRHILLAPLLYTGSRVMLEPNLKISAKSEINIILCNMHRVFNVKKKILILQSQK